jgi:hypothetical protein
LVYGRLFSHAFVKRPKTGVNETAFQFIRRFLALQTRRLGPSHHAMYSLSWYIEDRLRRYTCDIWRSMRDEWPKYMKYVTSETWKEGADNCTPVFRIPEIWDGKWVDATDSDMLQRKLRFMVNVQREYRQSMGQELTHLASLLKENPSCLKALGDGRQQPRPNIQHRIDRLVQDAQFISNLRFTARRQYAGQSHFNAAHLSLCVFPSVNRVEVMEVLTLYKYTELWTIPLNLLAL